MGYPYRLLQLAMTASLLMFTACKSDTQFENTDVFKISESQVSLKAATSQDIANHIADCNGNSDKICVMICHIAPGNSDVRKNKILPLPAVIAHLNHGHNHDHADYMGPCVFENPEPEPEPLPEPEPEPQPEPAPELPQWCIDNLDIDADCDGYIDDTGEPLY